MRLLLMSGLGPYIVNSQALKGTLFESGGAAALADAFTRLLGTPIDLHDFRHGGPSGTRVLRAYRGSLPHLPTAAVRSILDSTGIDYDMFELEDLWSKTREPPRSDYDVVALSTTFICDSYTLGSTVEWVKERFPATKLVLGGQFSNLKFAELLERHSEIDYIVRGDAEHAFPALLRALAGQGELADVPNLAMRREDGTIHAPPLEYIDMNAEPSPAFRGSHEIIPYESMRGCPFTCKFCSFPAASPKWRYKSAEKIRRDWAWYAEKNDAQSIRALDSTFTIPPARFKELLDTLPPVGVRWEAYTRANVISSQEVIDKLEAAHCSWLLVGFEAMNAPALTYMDKRVSVAQNVRAFELIRKSNIDIRSSFIVGYPGETPEDYEHTHRFLVDRYEGRFMLHFFTLVDETMPVWDDAELYELEAKGPLAWKHRGMTSETAMQLRERTLYDVRWKNEKAVLALWQHAYERTTVPGLTLRQNYRVEKLFERLAYLPRDFGVGPDASARAQSILDDLRDLGVEHFQTAPGSGEGQRHEAAAIASIGQA